LILFNEIEPFAAQWCRNLYPEAHVNERSIADLDAGDLVGFRRVHLFAGVGCWEYALRLAGWLDDVPVWTGSCPCQPFSAAGKRKGVQDERHLWPEMLRLIESCRPPVVFGEQVASSEVVGTQLEADFVIAVRSGQFARANKIAKRLVQSRGFHWHRRWVDGVRADLARIGYSMRFSVLGAHSVGAPHIRQRLFWVGYASGTRLAGRSIQPDDQQLASSQRAGSDAGGPGDASGDGRNQRRAEPGGSIGASGAGPWSDFEFIPCADGKMRRVVSRLAYVVNGISFGMDCVRPNKCEVTCAEENRPDKVLCQMSKTNVSEESWISPRGSNGFFEPQVLRQAMHGSEHGRKNQSLDASIQQEPSNKKDEGGLRGLRRVPQNGCSPCRWKSTQQRPAKLEDVVRLLPHAYSLARVEGDDETAEAVQGLRQARPSCWLLQYPLHTVPETWGPVNRSEVERAWREGCFESWFVTVASPVVDSKIPSRAALLRCIGNSIVPQVAAEFIREFIGGYCSADDV